MGPLLLLPLGLALGLDSLRAAGALGLVPLRRAAAARLVLAFGLCDGLASLAGIALGSALVGIVQPHVRLAGAILLAAYGVWVVLAVDEAPRREGLILTVPLALSLDNVGAGVAIGGTAAAAWPAALLLGATSAALAAAGLVAGRLVSARFSAGATRLAGVVLVGLAAAGAAGLA